MVSNTKTGISQIISDTPSIQVSYYYPGNEAEIVCLITKEMDGWPFHNIKCNLEDHWRWKHLHSPSGKGNVAVAWSDNKIVGCDHHHLKTVKIFDKYYPCGCACDTAVHSDFRKMGIYNKMAELVNDKSIEMNVNFGYWITVNPVFINLANKRNVPRPPFQLARLIWINDIESYYKENKSSNLFLKKTLFKIRKKLRVPKKSNDFGDYVVKEIECFDSDTEMFWREIRNYYDLIIERKLEYLNYRFCDRRAGDYQVKAVYHKDEMVGFCVIEFSKENQAKLIDFLTIPGDNVASNFLLGNVIDTVIERERNSVITWVLEKSRNHQVFSSNNFYNTRTIGPHLFFFERVTEMEEWSRLLSLDPNRVHFSMADTDIC